MYKMYESLHVIGHVFVITSAQCPFHAVFIHSTGRKGKKPPTQINRPTSNHADAGYFSNLGKRQDVSTGEVPAMDGPKLRPSLNLGG